MNVDGLLKNFYIFRPAFIENFFDFFSKKFRLPSPFPFIILKVNCKLFAVLRLLHKSFCLCSSISTRKQKQKITKGQNNFALFFILVLFRKLFIFNSFMALNFGN